MTKRITEKNVNFRFDRVNAIFDKEGKNTQWQMSGRNGYFGIDAGPLDGYVGYKTIITGCTKRQIYECLGVVLEAMEVLDGKPLPDKKTRDIQDKKREQSRIQYLDRVEKFSNRDVK